MDGRWANGRRRRQSIGILPCEKGSSAYRVKRYRERAEELRTIAEDLSQDECQQTLLRLAKSYEQMATQAASIQNIRGELRAFAAI